MTTPAQSRFMIYGPDSDGGYLIELRAADGRSLALAIPKDESGLLEYFQARMPYGLALPELPME